MAFVGSLSGSVGTIAVTGSFVPGADNTYNIGSSGSKWATVFANQLTGSLTKLADGSSYLIAGSNVTITSGANGAVTIAASSGGGGAGVFTEASNVAAYTTSSIAIGYAGAATSRAADTFFYVSGSTDGTKNALFDADVVTSGSVTVRDNNSAISIGYGPSSGVGQITSLNGNLVLDTTGGSRVIVDTDLEIAGANIYAGGGGGARNIFTDNVTPANLITIGGAGGKTTIAGGLEVTGNYISGSAGNNLTLGASGDVTVAGDLTVAGNDIKSSTATALTLAGTQVTAQGNLIVKGDLYISGTTTTIDSTVVEIQDPVIGLGFASGSVAGTAGDRGFIGGITGAGNNVALIWSQNSGTFAATRTATAPGSSPVVLSTLLPMRAARLEVNGAVAYITSSDTQTLELNGASGAGVKFTVGSGTEFARFIDNGAVAEFGAVANKQLNLSGSQVNLNAGSNGVFLQKNGTGFAQITGNSATLAITPQAGFLTASIVNTVADLINFGGAATVINVGNAAGTVTFNGNINANGNTTLGNATSDRVTFNAYVTSSILPSNDSAFDLGSPGLRWQNVYTGDLHLRNDRGDYTLIEEEDFLSIRFNKTGKRYKFLLEAVPELDEK